MSDLSDIPITLDPNGAVYSLAGQTYYVDAEGKWFADTGQGAIQGTDFRTVVRTHLRTLNPS